MMGIRSRFRGLFVLQLFVVSVFGLIGVLLVRGCILHVNVYVSVMRVEIERAM